MKFIFHKRFEKKYVKLDPKVRKSFRKRKDVFLKDPFDPMLRNHPLSGNRKGQWSINISGDWRAIYIFKNKETVIFIDIDTHSNLYK